MHVYYFQIIKNSYFSNDRERKGKENLFIFKTNSWNGKASALEQGCQKSQPLHIFATQILPLLNYYFYASRRIPAWDLSDSIPYLNLGYQYLRPLSHLCLSMLKKYLKLSNIVFWTVIKLNNYRIRHFWNDSQATSSIVPFYKTITP